MNVRMFLGDAPVDAVAWDDRGLAYGESLFETMRGHRGRVPWWMAHMARLRRGAEALAMPLPDAARMQQEAEALLDGGVGVLKLQLTRGGGMRGYAPASDALPFWMLSWYPLPASVDALDAIWCETRLAAQPRLAGLKHGNRLEQVLAAAEVRAAGVDEGLMRDGEGHAIAATAANLFILADGRWRTPRLQSCGVAGVMREWALGELEADIATLTPEAVETADAVFLCNAVRGILPVRRLGAKAWPQVHPEIRDLQARLVGAQPGFDPSQEAS